MLVLVLGYSCVTTTAGLTIAAVYHVRPAILASYGLSWQRGCCQEALGVVSETSMEETIAIRHIHLTTKSVYNCVFRYIVFVPWATSPTAAPSFSWHVFWSFSPTIKINTRSCLLISRSLSYQTSVYDYLAISISFQWQLTTLTIE